MRNPFFSSYLGSGVNRNSFLIILLILLVGISLRLYKLDKYSLSSDEAIIAINTSGMASDFIKRTENFIAASLSAIILFSYSGIVFLWRQVCGSSDFGLKLLSVVFGTSSIIAIYCLGKLFFSSKKAGLISAFILAISPPHIYYSQELSSYSLVTLLSILSVYFFKKTLNGTKRRFWLGYVFFNALNIYIHFMTFFLLFAEVVFFIFFWKDHRILLKKWLVSNFIILLLIAPCLFAVAVLLAYPPMGTRYAQWIPKPGLLSLFFTIKNFSIGYNAVKIVYLPATIFFLALLFCGIFKNKNRKSLSLALFCLVTPVFVIFLLSQFNTAYLDRFLIPLSVFFYLIIANGLAELEGKHLAAVLISISLLLAPAINNYYNNYLPGSFVEHIGIFNKNDCRAAADFIINEFNQGDVIFHTCRNTLFPFEYYFSRNRKTSLNDSDNSTMLFFNNNNDLLPYKYDHLNDKYIAQNNISIKNAQRAWIVFSHWDFASKRKDDSYSGLKVVNWMNSHYIRKQSREFNGVIVNLYSK